MIAQNTTARHARQHATAARHNANAAYAAAIAAETARRESSTATDAETAAAAALRAEIASETARANAENASEHAAIAEEAMQATADAATTHDAHRQEADAAEDAWLAARRAAADAALDADLAARHAAYARSNAQHAAQIAQAEQDATDARRAVLLARHLQETTARIARVAMSHTPTGRRPVYASAPGSTARTLRAALLLRRRPSRLVVFYQTARPGYAAQIARPAAFRLWA